MVELAYFYGWTLDYIRSLTIHELDVSREFMNKQSQGGETGGKKHGR